MKLFRYLITFSLLTLMLACGGAEDRKAAYMAKAEESIKSGNFEKARIELKNVLQIDPKDAAGYYKLGYVFERQKNYVKAFRYTNKAAELAPDNLEYQAKVGRFWLISGAGDIEKATEKMDFILSREPDNVNGLILKAGILFKQGNKQEALTVAEKIFDTHPENIENAGFLAELYSMEKKYAAAEEVLRKSIELNPDSLLLKNNLAKNLFTKKDYDGAEEIYRDILEQYPDVYNNYVTLAMFYQATGKAGKAEDVLNKGIETDPDDTKRILTLIDYINRTKGIELAIESLEGFIRKHQNMGELRTALGTLYVAEQDADKAIAVFKSASEDFSDGETGIVSMVALASLYMQQEDVKSAMSILEEAVEKAPNDSRVNLVQAKIALYNKNIEQAIISLRTVIKDDPENIEAYFLLAASHKANNENDQAEETIARAYENNRQSTKVLLPLAKYHIQNKNMAEAERVIDDYLELDGDNYDALSIKSALLNGKKNYQEAKELADRIIALYPNRENGYIQAVPALLDAKNRESAVGLLVSGYEKTDNNSKILKLLSEIEIATGNAESAITRLQQAIKVNDDEQLRLLAAKAYASMNDMDSVKSTLEKSVASDSGNVQSYLTLANIYLREGQKDKAISILQRGNAANKDDLKIQMTLAGIYEKSGEIDKAIDAYERMLDISENNLIVMNNLAALLSEHREDKKSLDRALTLAEKLKDQTQPVIRDTVAWVYYKTGNIDDAVRILNEIVAEMPDIGVFNYHLGMAYHKSGNKSMAKKYLEKATSGDSDFAGRDTAVNTLKNL